MHLREMLKDEQKFTKNASPELLKRFKLFKISEQDIHDLEMKVNQKRAVSRTDNYISRSYNNYTPLHTGVHAT